ncbi:MAG: phage minor head protein [Thermoanaerobaculia bacterium]|nr:phage minor head protein [Thermoanaerobaculia bacterium]
MAHLVAGHSSDDWAEAFVRSADGEEPRDAFLEARRERYPTLKETLRRWKARKVYPTDLFDALADELRGTAGRLVDVWHTRFVEKVYGSLFDAMASGATLADWIPEAQALLDQFGASDGVRIFSGEKWSPSYADLVFRNAHSAAMAGGRYAEMFSREWQRIAPFWLYDAVDDDRTRPAHAALDGMVFRKDDTTARRLLPPSQHNCFPAETLVSCAETKGFRASYAGPVVALETERGQRLTLTVNHPVLTARGWVAAQELREGDEVFAERPGVEGCRDTARLLEAASFVPRTPAHPVAAVGVDFDHRPSSAGERFVALGRSLGCCRWRWDPEDFDGDARFFDGDVDAVTPFGALLGNRQATAAKFLREFVLETAAATKARTHSARRALQLVASLFSTARGIPGGGALALDGGPVGAAARPLFPFGLGLTPERHAGLDQRHPELRARNADSKRDALQALPAFVRGAEVWRHEGRAPSETVRMVSSGRALPGNIGMEAARHAALSLSSGERAQAATERLSGLATRIRSVTTHDFRGDVFDFETAHGSIVANGICISNCRCLALEYTQRDVDQGKHRITGAGSLSPDVFPPRGWDADRVDSLVPGVLRRAA